MKKLFSFTTKIATYDEVVGAIVIANDVEEAWEMVKDKNWPDDPNMEIEEFDLNHATSQVLLVEYIEG